MNINLRAFTELHLLTFQIKTDKSKSCIINIYKPNITMKQKDFCITNSISTNMHKFMKGMFSFFFCFKQMGRKHEKVLVESVHAYIHACMCMWVWVSRCISHINWSKKKKKIYHAHLINELKRHLIS